MKICGVYWIRNKINNHIYIGSSRNVKHRIDHHRYMLNMCAHANSLLQHDMDELGLKNFSYRVLITCHPDMLHWYEQQFLDQWHPEYNVYPFADSPRGSKHSEETKEKISLAHMGYRHSEESKRKMSVSRMGNKNAVGNKNWLGRKHREESKMKISNSRKNIKYSEESKRKISESQKKRLALRREKNA